MTAHVSRQPWMAPSPHGTGHASLLREKGTQLGYVSTPHRHVNEEPVMLPSYSDVQYPTQCFGFYCPRLYSCDCSSQRSQGRLCSLFLHLRQLC